MLAMVATGKWLYDWTRRPEESILGVLLAAASWAAFGGLSAIFF